MYVFGGTSIRIGACVIGTDKDFISSDGSRLMRIASQITTTTKSCIMSSTLPHSDHTHARSESRNRRNPPSRPTTPLRPSSRSSLRESGRLNGNSGAFPETLEPAFAELSDSFVDLEANLMHLQLIHESLSRFSENFASFLYGMNMNAFCVDFPEAPVPDSFRRAREQADGSSHSADQEKIPEEMDGETTFMTTDTSFVDNPPTSSRSIPKSSNTTAPTSRLRGYQRGSSIPSGRGTRGVARGARSSGLARAAKPRSMN
ncbi:hypothetical protein K3495_g4692 [Podosphaera aphanis]|nr:hypothetical protein K3495_g4692 [Podosphaera aphanis]